MAHAGGSVDTHEPMYTGSTRGLETLVRHMESALTDEYPAALATLVWVDRVSHRPSNYQHRSHQPDASLATNTSESTMTILLPPKIASLHNPPRTLPINGTS